MNIKPGIGVGPAKFGMTEVEITKLFGEPDIIEQEEYIEGKGDWHRVLCCQKLHINFTFDKEDEYRLGTITIEGPNILVFDRDLFGLAKADVISFITSVSNKIGNEEDFTFDEERSLECIDYDGLGILLWFKSGNLCKIECSYLFESNNETVIWPK